MVAEERVKDGRIWRRPTCPVSPPPPQRTLAASMQTKNSLSVTPVDSTVASSPSTLPLWMSFCRAASRSALASCTIALSSPICCTVGFHMSTPSKGIHESRVPCAWTVGRSGHPTAVREATTDLEGGLHLQHQLLPAQLLHREFHPSPLVPCLGRSAAPAACGCVLLVGRQGAVRAMDSSRSQR